MEGVAAWRDDRFSRAFYRRQTHGADFPFDPDGRLVIVRLWLKPSRQKEPRAEAFLKDDQTRLHEKDRRGRGKFPTARFFKDTVAVLPAVPNCKNALTCDIEYERH
jgi:hypothetical protein